MPIKNKILDIKNLKKVRNKFNGKKIVLCHGVFDLLHVGHIDYFKSSKKHGNILVVSVTSDKFVNKGPGRPAFSINNRLKFLQAKEKVMVPNIISISSVFINVGLNFVLVFGFAGVGGIGEIGLAYASLSIRVLMLICILVYLIKSHVLEKVSIKIVTDLFKFNFPIGFLFFIEVLAFCTVTVLSGKFGVIDAAANNLIITFASISFMVPLSLASASSVKVGHSYGEQNLEKVNGYIKASLSLGGLYILFSMSMFLLFPKYLLAVSTNDPAVIELGVKLFFIVALFQVADVLQVILTGILRGLGVTKLPSFLVFLGYWLIGIPTGSYLAFNLDMRTQGLWWGLATALTVVSLFLFGLFFIKYLPKLKDNSLSV